MLTSYDPQQTAQMDVESRARQSLGVSMVVLAIEQRHPSGGVLVDVSCSKGKLWSFVGDRTERYIGYQKGGISQFISHLIF